MTPNERNLAAGLAAIALSVAADELEAEARAVPLGAVFYGGGLHDAPKFDVMMWAVRWMRGMVEEHRMFARP